MGVDDETETIGCKTFLFRNLLDKCDHFSNQLWWSLEDGWNSFFGNDKDVRGRLRIFVSNRKGVVRFGYVTLSRDILEWTWLRIEFD